MREKWKKHNWLIKRKYLFIPHSSAHKFIRSLFLSFIDINVNESCGKRTIWWREADVTRARGDVTRAWGAAETESREDSRAWCQSLPLSAMTDAAYDDDDNGSYDDHDPSHCDSDNEVVLHKRFSVADETCQSLIGETRIYLQSTVRRC